MAPRIQLEPPEGGWGILVCVGMALSFISGLSALPSFGLVFGDFLKSIGAETSAIAFITSFFFCALSFAGLFSGPLFSRFGLRATGLIGGLLYVAGSVVQIFTTSIWSLTLAFSVLQGCGFGLIIPASYTTFNNYFVKKRIMWMSFAQSLIGLGSMFYPVFMQKLMDWYGFRGCLLVLAAINLHVIFGMLLMQPVEWHMKRVVIDDPEELKDIATTLPPNEVPSISISRKETFINGNSENEEEIENEAQNQLSPLAHYGSQRLSKFSKEDLKMLSRRSSSIASLGNWSGPVVVTDVSPEMIIRSRTQSNAASLMKDTSHSSPVPQQDVEEVKRSICQILVDFLDLTLLKQPIYVNIVLGISFALYSDIAFFTLQPLYLFELGFSKHDTASVIAIGAAADLGSRIFLAFSAIFIQMPSRYIYLSGAFFTIIARFAFFQIFDFKGMACITAVMGFMRTWIHVPLPLVFGEYLPKERFAAGYGLFMFLQGNIVFLVGPLVGYLRDTTKDYILTFHVLNVFMALCVVPWIIEIVCVKFRRKEKLRTDL